MIIRQILIGLLASIVLTASTGATIHQMVCLHSGNAEYSFNDIDCCKVNNEQESVARCCCEYFSITYQYADLANTNSEYNYNLVVLASSSSNLTEQQFFPKNQIIPNQYNLPPPHKQAIYKELQSFLC
ncbi:MAG: hypothetical protein OSB25_05825 [Salibacteraceae bacterium]|nr:hypothetical protein [Salibacteraceae bacterium]|tara:strand:- start:12747 stop:13130 length:384 start_codon:yes stop_codon:yes gene_type:complete